MTQLSLFSESDGSIAPKDIQYRPDADTEGLLAAFENARHARGAHPQSVRREASPLRAILREARVIDPTVTIRTLVVDLDLLARVLREPAAMISRSTGRARLLAVQRFIRLTGDTLGRDSDADLAALDARLPTRRSIGWHTTGALMAGTTGRRWRRGPTLDASDLRRLVDAAGSGVSNQATRDRALVALHSFTGLRPEEIGRLRWEDFAMDLTASGYYGLTATVSRRGRQVTLLLPTPASHTVEALAGAMCGAIESLSGPVLCARGAQGHPLSYRTARDVLQDACRRAGLPTVESASLRSACAHWLRSQRLSDHEVAAVLGLARVRSVDRLLRHHAALDAQRIVRENISR